MNISQKSAFRLMSTTVLSTLGLLALAASPVQAQTKPAKTEQQAAAQASAEKTKQQVLELDTITISPLSNDQAVIDAIASTSLISRQQIDRIQPVTSADIFRFTPGVHASLNGDDPATSINIRGLQQYGRVAVTLDGARQDYWRVGHGSGSFYIEPELLK